MATKTTKRVVAYVRVSRVGDRELRSHELQERAIRSYCDTHGFEIVDLVVDLDSSGAKAGRKKLRAIVERRRAREIDGIAVYKLDRLSRMAPRDRGKLVDEIEEDDGLIVSASEGHDWTTPEARLMRELFFGIARYEWETRAGGFDVSKRDALDRGVHISGKVPVGYVRDAKTKRLAIDLAKAPAILAAFELRATGASYGEIVRALNERLPGGPSGKGVWMKQTAKRVLANPVYRGEARGVPGEPGRPDSHPELVDEQTFASVQALATRRERSTSERESEHLLSGLVRCANCGSSIAAKQSNGRYSNYRCEGRLATGKCEKRATISEPALDEYVTQTILGHLADAKIEQSPTVVDVREIHERLASAKAKRETYSDVELIELLGVEKTKQNLRQVDDEIAAIESELRDAIPTSSESALVVDALEQWEQFSTSQRREVIASVVESVIVSDAGVAIDERAGIVWKGEMLPLVVPSRGRPKRSEVEAGMLAT